MFRPTRPIRQLTDLRPGTPTIAVGMRCYYNATYDPSGKLPPYWKLTLSRLGPLVVFGSVVA